MKIKDIESITIDDITKIASMCDNETQIIAVLCGVNKIDTNMSSMLYRLIRYIKGIKYDDITVIHGNPKTKDIYFVMKNGKKTSLYNILHYAMVLRLSLNTTYGLSIK